MQNALCRLSLFKRRTVTKTLIIMTSSRKARSHRTISKTIILAMNLTAILLLAGCLQLSAKGLTQGLTMSKRNAPLQEVFKDIEKQTGYQFFYKEKALDGTKAVSINVKDASLEQVLQACFKDQPITYNIVDKIIVVTPKQAINPNEEANLRKEPPPPIDVHGRITNDNGEPVVGASVKIKGTDIGTSTNNNGEFTLNVLAPDMVLVITGVNIETTEVPIAARTNIAITAKIKNSPLDEMQVIAYGTTTKRLNTGSVSTIKSKDIGDKPVSNPLQVMQGRMTGVFITQSSGLPGSAYNILVRGQNSIGNGNSPLFIIDGVPYLSQLLQNQNPAGGNPLNFIDPSDVESIDVLKDADATAIYGSRGANGVVLITTKKGKPGVTKVDVNVYAGVGKAPLKVDWLNTQQYLEMRREAFKNDNVIMTTNNAPDILFWDTTRYTNWQKELIGGTSRFMDAQVNLSGGTTSLQYLFGGGYHRESTVFPMDGANKKVSSHFSITSESANKRFKFVFSGNYISDFSDLPKVDLTGFLRTAPVAPAIYDSLGNLNWAPLSTGAAGTWTNPFSFSRTLYKSRNNNLIGSTTLSFRIAKGLDVRGSIGYNNLMTNEVATTPISSLDPGSSVKTGSASFVENSVQSWIIEPHVNYQFDSKIGQLFALLGTTFQQNKSDGKTFLGSGYTSDALIENLQAAPTLKLSNLTNTVYKYNALFGRLTYNYANIYLLNFSMRRDGSGRFGPNKQFHNFGALGAAWIFSNEKFVADHLQFLTFGKLKTSYGTTGSDQISDYLFYDLYNTTTNSYQNVVGLTPRRLYNPDLAWEETRKLEGGLELGFFKDKFLLEIDYYKNRSSNQLITYPLSTVTGFSNISLNLPATVGNTGWEFSLSTRLINSKVIQWTSVVNLTVPKNKLLSFPNFDQSSFKSSYIIGEPINIIKLYRFIGVDPQTGTYRFYNSKGDTTFTPSFQTDMTTFLNRTPKYYGGFQNNISYKSFQLEIFLQFVKQFGSNYLLQPLNPAGFQNSNQPEEILNRWKSVGDVTTIAAFTQQANSLSALRYSYAQSSDFNISDASYIRIKNIGISYRLPITLLKKLNVEQVRLYFQGQNLFTITKYKGLDPENQSFSSLPPLRVLSAGAQIVL